MFQTIEDLHREASAADRIASQLAAVPIKFDDYSAYDHIYVRSLKAVALSEIKGRPNDPYAKYRNDGIFLSLAKLNRCRPVSRALKIRGLLFFAFTDQILWLDVESLPENPPTVMRGRYDRGAENDVEPIILLFPPHLSPLADLRSF